MGIIDGCRYRDDESTFFEQDIAEIIIEQNHERISSLGTLQEIIWELSGVMPHFDNMRIKYNRLARQELGLFADNILKVGETSPNIPEKFLDELYDFEKSMKRISNPNVKINDKAVSTYDIDDIGTDRRKSLCYELISDGYSGLRISNTDFTGRGQYRIDNEIRKIFSFGNRNNSDYISTEIAYDPEGEIKKKLSVRKDGVTVVLDIVTEKIEKYNLVIIDKDLKVGQVVDFLGDGLRRANKDIKQFEMGGSI